MPPFEVAFPVTSTHINLVQRDEVYPILLDTDTFDRAGADGDIPILPLNGGNEYVGEALEGQWHKGWDANISAFTATISGGTLRMTGVAAVAGTAGYGWINSYHPVPFLDDLELTVSMEVPVDDTGATANRDIFYSFLLKQDKNELRPTLDNNYLRIYSDVDESGIIYYVTRNVNGAATTLFSGSTYDDASGRTTGDLEATIWRLVFSGKPGTPGSSVAIYLKQGATLATAEVAVEHELTTSPYDMSGLAICVAYPAYEIYTQNVTYFGATYDSVNRAASTYLRVDYLPQFTVKYDCMEANIWDGEVELYDGNPDSGGIRVYDEDHEFAGNPYLQNGLIRLRVYEMNNVGCYLYAYYGGVWSVRLNDYFNLYLRTSAMDVTYPKLRNVVKLSSEEVVLNVRFHNSATINEDYYIDATITLCRGKPYIIMEVVEVYPQQEFYYYTRQVVASRRFAYVGNNCFCDADFGANVTNTTLTDNVLVAQDNEGYPILLVASPNLKTTNFQTLTSSILYMVIFALTERPKILVGAPYFALVANTFKEAELATLGGGATAVVDALASGGQAALLNAQNETVYYNVTAGTSLPAGRYLAAFRIRDTNHVANDVGLRSYNNSDTSYRNEQGTWDNRTATATYAYYSHVFDITGTDVTGTDAIYIQVNKQTATANDIYVDYFLLVPIGNGMSFPQDLTHGAMRTGKVVRRVEER